MMSQNCDFLHKKESIMLMILFGLAGAGKTYVGKLLAKNFDLHFEDADDWITEDMRAAIEQGQPFFSEKMRDDFTKVMIANIKQLLKKGHKNIVIAQALYRQKNRVQILDAFPDAIFAHVDASDEIIMQRLVARGGKVNLEFADLIKEHFELMPGSLVINNNEDGGRPVLSSEHIEKAFLPKGQVMNE